MKIVYTGGGTLGHFYPLIAVSDLLKSKSYDLKMVYPKEYYFGSKNMDENMLNDRKIAYSWVPSGKNRLYFSILNFCFSIFT